MNESVGTALQPAYDVVRTLRRRWKRVVAVGTFVLALAIVALVVWPRTYVSEGEVFVQMGHESVALDPTATTGTTVPIFENRENEINSALEMLQSREVLTRVVKRLSATVILNGIMTEEGVGVGGPEDGNGLVAYCQETVEGAADSVKRWMDRGEPISEDELAVVKLEKSVKFEHPRKSSVIKVTAKAKSPYLAKLIVDTMMEEFREVHRGANRIDGSSAFFAKKKDELYDELQLAADRLKVRKDELGVVTIEGRRNLLLTQLEKIETELVEAKTELATSEGRLRGIERSMSSLEPRIDTVQVSVANSAKDGMQIPLYELKIREKELASKYSDDHPSLVTIREQVRQAEQVVDGQSSQRTEKTSDINPAYVRMDTELAVERANLHSLETRHQALLAGQHELRDQLALVTTSEKEIMNLEREMELLDEHYRTYSQKLEQARITDQLRVDKISNLNSFQMGSLVRKPASPKKRIVLALGLLAAVLSGCCAAVMADYADPRMRNLQEVERKLDIPVLLSVPRSPRHRIRV